ncbi:PrgI family protein, partial [Saccharopolyspora cebuensis]
WLHSLTAPAQILVRTQRLDLSAQITDLDQRAPTLPHPALEAAAREHADYLADLAAGNDLLHRQVLLVLREPRASVTSRTGVGIWRTRRDGRDADERKGDAEHRAAEARLARRLNEATELLHPAGITVTPLDAEQATAVLASACNPDRLVDTTTDLAPPDGVITAARDEGEWS